MADTKIPLIVLAGRDRHATGGPRGEQRNLSGFKAVDTRLDGQPLIAVLLERLRAVDAFDPIFIAGSAAVYAPLRLDARLIDTDDTCGGNLRNSVEAVVDELRPSQLGITTCDILPEREDLENAMADFRRHQPLDFWMPQHRVRDDEPLGTSDYKPRYFIRPDGEHEPAPTLPGHLILADPLALRRDLMYRIFDFAYETRNLDVAYRRSVIIKRALSLLLRADLRLLRRGELPTTTLSMVLHGYRLGTKLKRRDVSARAMEHHLRKIWITAQHRRRYPTRRGRVAVISCRSLARDVDTVEEANELIESFQDRA